MGGGRLREVVAHGGSTVQAENCENMISAQHRISANSLLGPVI